MRRDIDIPLLRAFVAVVETGSVTGAAALLNLTQAAVSQQLKRLEDLLGIELFERHHKRLSLKPAGERLMAHANKLIALNDEVWSTMSAPAYEGEVRLGVPHDIVGPYLPPILKRFDKAWPRVRVSMECMTTSVLLDMLKHGQVDITLTTEQRCRPNGETLMEDDLVWTGARNGTAHLRDPLPLSIGGATCEFRASALKSVRDSGRDWRPVCEVSNMEALFASIRADLSIGAFLRGTIPDFLQEVEDSKLAPMPKFLVNMYLPAARQTDIAVELARTIRQEFARLRRPGVVDLSKRARKATALAS
jgi:DNA-binding transcriptional LysR family regulator